MIVNIDYADAMDALKADLLADDAMMRCQRPDCGSPRLEWYCTDDGGRLVVNCEDCSWSIEQAFDGTSYQ